MRESSYLSNVLRPSLHITRKQGKTDEALIKMHLLGVFRLDTLLSCVPGAIARDVSCCTRTAVACPFVINANFLIRISVGTKQHQRESVHAEVAVAMGKTSDNERKAREEETRVEIIISA